MNGKRYIWTIALAAMTMVAAAQADTNHAADSCQLQNTVALKNNVAYDAALSPNLGLEWRRDSAWSVGVNAGLSLWDFDHSVNRKWRHVMVSPYVRYWPDSLCHGRFVSLHAVYSHYNVGNVSFPLGLYPAVKDSRRQGNLYALGLSVGRNWRLGGRWHLEAELGAALGYTRYRDYSCSVCGTYRGNRSQWLALPKVGLNLVYRFARRLSAPEPAATEGK